jgi:hypothetical protein
VNADDVIHMHFLELLLACLDGDDERAHEIIGASDAERLAHHCVMQTVVASYIEQQGNDRALFRASVQEELDNYRNFFAEENA